MTALKQGLAALMLMAGLSGQALAQSQGQRAAQGVNQSGFPNYPGAGTNFDYYALSTGFGNYGLPGSYPGYSGHALSGYGPGAPVGGYFTSSTKSKAQMTDHNTDGVINSKKTPTGKSPAYPYGATRGVSRPRRSR